MEPNVFDKVQDVDLKKTMENSYIDYAMSVIVSRAIPDVRDGLKPVQRRVLYSLQSLGVTPDKKTKKCATIVGECMGKFHPHGDSSIYGALVYMGQSWSMRHVLVDKQGNFGSDDGDSPAAMRYTEAKMSKLAGEMLAGINKDTVDFMPNFSNEYDEPTVLPAKFPNLIVNGATGIAVFMATNHHYIMFFTNTGRCFRIKAYNIPEASRTSRGTALVNLLQLGPDEHVTASFALKDDYPSSDQYLLLATKNGMVKKTPIADYANIRKTGLIAMTLRDDDQLIEAKLIDAGEDVMIGTRNGMAIRFNESDVRVTGRSSMGVRGISLDADDEVIGMQKLSQGDYVLVVSEKGMGKLTHVDEFKAQKRGGKGLHCYRITEKTGKLVGFKLTAKEREIMLITNEGVIIRMSLKDAKDIGRNTSGVKFMNIDPDSDTVIASIAKVRESTTEAYEAELAETEADTEESDELNS